jgi:hypothetical protein
MMTRLLVVVVLVVVPALNALGEEEPADSQISSVAMFKNGLVVVKRTVEVPGPGTYLVSDVPVPVHGTFWIESDAGVEARVSLREMEVALQARHGVDFQEELAGRDVVVHFHDGGIPPASGKVLRLEPASGEEAWDRTYQQRPYWRSAQSPPRGRFLILETEKGRVYVDSSRIAYAQVQATEDTVFERRPVLLLDVTDKKEGPATIGMSYLAKGMGWAPSYRLDISNPKELTIEQKAVIKNELENIEKAEVYLISGFPSVQFAHVTSPLSLRTGWASFFQQLNQRIRSGEGLSVATQQRAVTSNVIDPYRGPDISAIPMGEGPDIHYESIGERSLAEGESLSLSVATGSAPYERLVEWILPDTRTANGRRISNPEKHRDAAWDAVRFRNPLPFPMTTGAAMVVGNGRFHGQRLSFWVNKGEEATIHITKALSIRTRSVEHEEPGEREIVYIAGNDYQKTVVKGELFLSNHRGETIQVVIRRRFSGELLEADGEPKSVLREEGAWSVNKRNELTWSLTLEPGEEKDLSYRYSLLVDR